MTKAPPRPSMSKARRARIFETWGGACYLCGVKIAVGEPWEAEHVIPWALGHDDSDGNLRPAHKGGECHGAKTRADVKQIAKAKRQARETGAQRIGKVKRLIASRGFDKGGPKRKLPSRPFR